MFEQKGSKGRKRKITQRIILKAQAPVRRCSFHCPDLLGIWLVWMVWMLYWMAHIAQHSIGDVSNKVEFAWARKLLQAEAFHMVDDPTPFVGQN